MSLRVLFAAVFALMAATAAKTQAEDKEKDKEESPLVKHVKSKVKDVTKPFAIIAEFKVKEGKAKDFEEAFAPFIEATRKEAGCVAFYLVRDAERPDVYVVYEHFKSVEALQEHVKLPHAGLLLKTIRPLQDGAGKFTVYTIP